ncbi:Protein argonaute 2 [Linum grandiflorum]
MEDEGYQQKLKGRGGGGCRRGRGVQKGSFVFREGDVQYQPEFNWDDGRRSQGHFGPTRGRGRGGAMPPTNGGSEDDRGRGRGRYGRGRGRGRGRSKPREEAAESLPPPPPPIVAGVTPFHAGQFPNDDDVFGSTKSMSLSDNLDNSFAPSADKVVPVNRPDKGGTMAIRNTKIRVNHFPVRFNPQSTIRHYDVNVKPDDDDQVQKKEASKLSKSSLRMIRDKLFSDDPSHFPMSMTAYDGEKNIFSAVPLPTGQFKVELPDRNYIFSIKLVNELKLCRLKDYLSGNLFCIPRGVLQGMDVVMKENPVRNMISTGRSFHPKDGHYSDHDNLGLGIRASRGFQHSLKPTFQGLAMCLDYSVLAFRKRLPVLDFLKEHIPGFSLNDFRRFRKAVEKELRGLKVNVTHRMTKQKFVVSGLTKDNARRLKFPTEDPSRLEAAAENEILLVEYFRDKYKMDIMYKDIPCLELGKSDRKNYVPMELCVLVEGQIYPKEHLDKNAAVFLKRMSLAKPDVRRSTICHMVNDAQGNGPCGGEVIRNFGMEVDTNMTSVVGRVIAAPELKLCNRNGAPIRVPVDKDKCQWNLLGKRVVEGKSISRWGVIDFSSSDRHRLNQRIFVPNLITRCRNLGMLMEDPLFVEPSTMHMLSNPDALQELLESLNDRAYQISQGKLQILVCVMSGKHPGYKNLKWISETRVGLVTQCCLLYHANEGNDQYLANLALKINAKLGGSNAELFDKFPFFEQVGGGGGVMFIGADVNHPASRNTTSPSISAVVATVNWPAANRYAARVRPQNNRVEKIVSFGDMCLELVESYARLNTTKPEKIVIFRDGVSEGQFDMVLNEELLDMKSVFRSNNYNPTVTLIVAQKRHQTRLFPENQRDGGFTGNVSPGTVVDTKIVHPFEFDFYLCSHYGSLGTSKPTHYHVLWDEHSFTSDQVQKLIYNLCFTFARCTKPVSLVPPVYYADLVAYRGRLYYEAVMEGQSPASVGSTVSSTASSSTSSSTSLDDRFYRLHADLENDMFFI